MLFSLLDTDTTNSCLAGPLGLQNECYSSYSNSWIMTGYVLKKKKYSQDCMNSHSPSSSHILPLLIHYRAIQSSLKHISDSFQLSSSIWSPRPAFFPTLSSKQLKPNRMNLNLKKKNWCWKEKKQTISVSLLASSFAVLVAILSASSLPLKSSIVLKPSSSAFSVKTRNYDRPPPMHYTVYKEIVPFILPGAVILLWTCGIRFRKKWFVW